jgi:hypothetical protein
MKINRLIVISDITGKFAEKLVNDLTKQYKEYRIYNACELADINSNLSKEEKHKLLVNGGIEKAVFNLIELEDCQVDIFAFSIGGTIAWKAALHGLKINKLKAYSSTRLRYEKDKPNCKIELLYGANDKFKPDVYWFKKIDIQPILVENGEHEFYLKA